MLKVVTRKMTHFPCLTLVVTGALREDSAEPVRTERVGTERLEAERLMLCRSLVDVHALIMIG